MSDASRTMLLFMQSVYGTLIVLSLWEIEKKLTSIINLLTK
jgi:hypothetical protein